ncbi:MFS general substrate transporter [Rhizopus microsporus var. microsporus]|uniref:MFS general substrate transporter n=1 Tax=Rhizopus microsporus var. microsporus TaxID=86635 RepID=A0A1X0R7J8_RHIZD|nr:MFS general substrate transporter [Rhizopus microsporus var. microsporus]
MALQSPFNLESTISDSTKIEPNGYLDDHHKTQSMISLNNTSTIDVYSTMEDAKLYETINELNEKKLVKKLDLRIMPLFCLFYFADFLDRANIGNAAIAGLQADLKMSSTQLSTAISAFFITYIIFEIPSNIILERTNAAKWLSFIMFVWGLATLMTAFVKDFTGLFILRLILGAAESGYIPGILFLLSKVYKPQEFSIRVGILLTMATLSGVVSGPLTYLVSSWEGKNGLHGWQYLFITEGAPTVLLSIISYFFLFDDLNEVGWLTNEQKLLQEKRIMQHVDETIHSNSNTTLKTLSVALSDWKTWAFGIIFFLNSINLTSLGVFAPALISGFGFDMSTTQLLTAPPCVTATIGVLLGGYLGGKYNCRSPILAVGSIIVAAAYLCLYLLYDKWALYSTLLVVPIGIGLQASASLGWSALNYPDLTVRAVGVAAVIMIGNIGNIVASFLFKSSDAPRYAPAVLFNLVTAIVSGCLSGLTGLLLYRINRRLDSEPNDKDSFRYFY